MCSVGLRPAADTKCATRIPSCLHRAVLTRESAHDIDAGALLKR